MNYKYPGQTTLLKVWLVAIVAFVVVDVATPCHADTLVHDIDAILQSPALDGAISGIEVVELKSGKTLYEHNATSLLIPASNRKLFTAALGMANLGPDFTFATRAIGATKASDGAIDSDVTLVGTGDATFTSADAHAMAQSMYDSGIRTIIGHILGNGGAFTDGPYPEGWQWDTLSDDYAPEISALEIDEGVMQITVSAPSEARAPDVSVSGPAGYVTIDNAANVGPAGSTNTLRVYRLLGRNEIRIEGNVPVGAKIDPDTVTVNAPATYATVVFKQALRNVGITVKDQIIEYDGVPRLITLAEHHSVPLSQYLKLMLKPSDNLMAECLIRAVGEKDGRGSFHNAEAVEADYMRDAGVLPVGYSFADGSGVSRMNLVSPAAIVRLLTHVTYAPWFQTYYNALPIAGVDGTLRHRLESGPAKGNAHAKTGTVRHDHCLSGFVTAHDGRMLVFSIMNNNYNCDVAAINKVQDAIVQRLAAD